MENITADVENVGSETTAKADTVGMVDEPGAMATVAAATDPTAANDPTAASLDQVTALEMLQFLKEYKKRELLYVSEISKLQKELAAVRSASSVENVAVSQHSNVALVDPAINMEIRELRLTLHEVQSELQKAKDELRASTFSPDNVMGLRLIGKCRALQEENTDIGRMLIENQLQPLQIQISVLQKQLTFFKKQLVLMHETNTELDRDNQSLVKQLHEMTRLLEESRSPTSSPAREKDT